MNRLEKIRLLLYSLAYSRPSQLAARLRLTLKRKVISTVGFSRPAGGGTVFRGPAPAIRADLPKPVFPPRSGRVDRDGYLLVLNNRVPLRLPMDWHPPAWKRKNRLELMTLHYMEYLETLDDRTFSRVIRDWIRHNHPRGPGYWLDSWNSYSVSLRCLVWMQQYALRRERVEEETGSQLLLSLIRQVRFLRRNLEEDIKGNHLIKNCKTLIWAGRFFRGREAARWLESGKRILFRELREQVLPDGTHYERSPSYHLQVFADLLECYRALDGFSGARKELAGVLEKMARAAVDLTHPDGRISLFNDGGLGMSYLPGECLEAFRRLIGPPPDPGEEISLPAAGYYGIRRAGEYLLVDGGEIGPDYLPAHGHGDLLALEWDLGGRRVFVDPGVYEYREGEMRRYSRSTGAHNTVALDDFDQCEFWGSFRAGRRARPRIYRTSWSSGRFVFSGSQDGYRRLPGRPVHHRRIESAPGSLRIEDRVTGGRGQVVRAGFLCHPDNEVFLRGRRCCIIAGNLKVTVITEARIEVREGWYMPDFGVCRPARRIVLEYGRAPCAGSVIFKVSRSD